jgi:ATP-binding cassette subfamily B protein
MGILGVLLRKKFPHQVQPDAMDCGATCLAMIAKHYGKNYTIQKLREMCSATRAGVSLRGISDAAEKLGFKTIGTRLNFEKLADEVPLPCIVHWRQEHFVVVYDIKVNRCHRKQN